MRKKQVLPRGMYFTVGEMIRILKKMGRRNKNRLFVIGEEGVIKGLQMAETMTNTCNCLWCSTSLPDMFFFFELPDPNLEPLTIVKD